MSEPVPPEAAPSDIAGDLPGISVVVPVRNGAATIVDCLSAILNQDYPPDRFEILMVDNGSTDDTVARAKALSSDITIVEESTPGPSAARNTGAAWANHPLIAFTDSDCFPVPGWLSALVRHRRVQPEADFIGGPIVPRDPENPAERYGQRFFEQERVITHEKWPFAISANLMIAKSRLQAFGSFDEQCRLGEDVELSYRALLHHDASFSFAADAVVRHANPRSYRAIYRKGRQHGQAAAFLRKRFDGAIPASSFGARTKRELRRVGGLYAVALFALLARALGRRGQAWEDGQSALFEALYRSGKLRGMAAGPLSPPPARERPIRPSIGRGEARDGVTGDL